MVDTPTSTSARTSVPSDESQTALWNGVAGQAWIDAQDMLDQMFRGFERLLADVVAAKTRACVLDVGCGTGATTLAIASRLGPEGRCVGIDISEPMLERARSRAERAGARVSFLCADAEFYAFEPESFDTFVSRFGVMFFSDSVRAFANLRRAARAGAELCFLAWRSAAENPFMTTAERAASSVLPNIPPRPPGAPGQFAFADEARVRRILEESGWTDTLIHPIDVECSFAEEDLDRYMTRFGPLGRHLHDADQPTRERVLAVIRPAFDPYIEGGVVRFRAACWKIGARAGDVHA